jgi:hypothetical protein
LWTLICSRDEEGNTRVIETEPEVERSNDRQLYRRSTTKPRPDGCKVRQGLTDDLKNAPHILPLTPLLSNSKPAPDDIYAVELPYSDEPGEGGVAGFGRG